MKDDLRVWVQATYKLLSYPAYIIGAVLLCGMLYAIISIPFGIAKGHKLSMPFDWGEEWTKRKYLYPILFGVVPLFTYPISMVKSAISEFPSVGSFLTFAYYILSYITFAYNGIKYNGRTEAE